MSWWNLSPARRSLLPDSPEIDPYVRISNALLCLFVSEVSENSRHIGATFWTFCFNKVLYDKNKSPQVSLRSLSFQNLDLWWADGVEDRQSCQLSSSPRVTLENRGAGKGSSRHPWPWWTVWSSRTWCAAAGRVSCLCPPEGYLWCSLHGTNSSRTDQSLFVKHWACPSHPTCTESTGTWWTQTIVPTTTTTNM